MAASRQDQVIDDDEPETCPLCIEELDLSDRGFRPCPCGYQICQFCYNNIKTTMNGLCPACRRPYEEKNIKFDAPSAEEVARYKENKTQQDKKRAAAKRQEAASRQADTLSRKHLAGIRVRRQNLVYVTGLRLNTSDPVLSEKLRGDQFFGQYGKIDKIVVNRPKDSRALQPVGVYITYFDKDAAALCIDMVNGSQNAGGTIRADYGTTKYCSAFLRHETCSNKNCTFLHEVGEDNESFTREGLSSLNASGTQSSESEVQAPVAQASHQPPPPSYDPPHVQHLMERSDSRSDSASGMDTVERPALPSHASWAQRQTSSRRPSQTHSFASGSPLTNASIPVSKQEDSAIVEIEEVTAENPATTIITPPTSPPQALATSSADDVDWRAIRKILASDDGLFVLDESDMTREDIELLQNFPLLFDPDGGARRFAARRREDERRLLEKDQQVASQALSGMTLEDATAGGSLQLGGEPEERQDVNMNRRQNVAIQPPTNELMSPTFDVAQVLSPASQTQSMGARSSSVNQQQDYGPPSFKSTSPSLHSQSTGNAQGGQYSQSSLHGGMGHARQSSRFSFANDSTSSSAKPNANAKFMNQASANLPPTAQIGGAHQQSSFGNQFFSSGVQGPPPGLKTTGTPPVSGGGMFGQGHGFATSGLGYGVNSASRNVNDELMRELMRNRGGSAGSGQTSEGGRREYMFPSSLHHSSPPQNPGLSSFPYGSHPAALQDHGPQKQKKKGKKHRQANTSSSGGGVVDLADPSILRMHASAGQGHYGSHGQGQGGFSSTMYSNVGGGYGRY